MTQEVQRAPTVFIVDDDPSILRSLQRLLQWYRDQHKTPEELLEQEVVRNWIPASNTV